MNMQSHHSFEARTWSLAHGKSLTLGPRGILMGILNVTPDSFSDGGKFDNLDAALNQTLKMLEAGAHIIDVGGESTKPNADPVTAEQEQDRILPVVERLVAETETIISIDTYRAQTAKLAIDVGAHIINDVWGFQHEPQIAKVAADAKAGCCLMHTGRNRNRDRDVIKDQIEFLSKSVEIARAAGVEKDRIVLDPGFGFAKDPDENMELLANFEQLHTLGFPLLCGTSRKRFIGHFANSDPDNRDVATSATTVVARLKGSAVFRVHDVAKNRDALSIADAIIAAKKYGS